MKVERLKDFDELEVAASSLEVPGLFQTVSYLRAFGENFSKEVILLSVEEDGQVVGYGAFEEVEDVVYFLGMKPVFKKEEITDFGDIVARDYKKAWEVILEWFEKKGFKQLRLDYVREDSESFKVLKSKGKTSEQEVAPQIKLPKTWEEYLGNLKREHRKELKRKIKRLEDKESFYECSEETVKQDFEEFVRLHRLSDGKKKQFMSEKMKEFFWQVKTAKHDGWWGNLCFLKMEGKPVAGLMCFENKQEGWAYNSGFDPDYGYYSVGILLMAYKIKRAIEKDKKIFSFLRGDERYKYELGGEDLRLFKIEMSF